MQVVRASDDGALVKKAKGGVGRYLKLPKSSGGKSKLDAKKPLALPASAQSTSSVPSHYKPKFKATKTKFGNFSGW